MIGKSKSGFRQRHSEASSRDNLKLSNAWVPQINFIIVTNAEDAIAVANYDDKRKKGDLKSRNVGQSVIVIANKRTKFP